MSEQDTYDAHELRALAVALDVIDPQDPDEWDGDAEAFEASVTRGRERLERRGLASFARDGGAEVDLEDAGMLRAFLAPNAVIEAWIVDGSAALRREWYVGPQVAVVADPATADGEQQELTTIGSREVFADVTAFLDIRGKHHGGDPVRIDSKAIDDFPGYPAVDDEPTRPAPRLMNITAAWEHDPAPRELQLLDAGTGGVWLVAAVEREGATNGAAHAADIGTETVELSPVPWSEIVDRLLAVLIAQAPAR